MKKIFFLLFVLPLAAYGQTTETDIDEIKVKRNSRIIFGFRRFAEDKYFVGMHNPRNFLTRFSMITNVHLSNAILSRDQGSEERWFFPGVVLSMEARIATEFSLMRSKWVGISVGGALEIPMLGRINPSTVNVYGILGDAAVIFDFYLPQNWRLRFIPVYHQSVHLADGYRGNTRVFDILSYEFMSLEIYKRWNWFTFYGGVEVTYNASAERLLRMRLHTGVDFRYHIWREISFVTGIHLGGLWDESLPRHPEAEGWHPAVNFGIGFEFSRVMIQLKISHQRPFEAATYHFMQTKVGLEVSLFL